MLIEHGAIPTQGTLIAALIEGHVGIVHALGKEHNIRLNDDTFNAMYIDVSQEGQLNIANRLISCMIEQLLQEMNVQNTLLASGLPADKLEEELKRIAETTLQGIDEHARIELKADDLRSRLLKQVQIQDNKSKVTKHFKEEIDTLKKESKTDSTDASLESSISTKRQRPF